jgi:hypothetical protein
MENACLLRTVEKFVFHCIEHSWPDKRALSPPDNNFPC